MVWEEMPEIALYSDGGAEPNPGHGGFGVILSYKGVKKEFSQGFTLTTNNRMELMGVIHGLEKLKTRSIVTAFTDSQYVVNGIEKGWAQKWKSKNWYRNKGEKATNFDLWERLLLLISSQEKVEFRWIKGHAGHPENERCDELAMLSLNGNGLLVDDGYLSGIKQAVKIEEEGDPCRKCGTKVVRKPTKKGARKPGQLYYFDYYLFCPGCKTMYFTEDAKRENENGD
ncbi:MAG: ribonuclease HI [Puia sp.]